tara:strand:+ start:93 stop:1196 length:1104 start_codon:yes stop_codon:yes gene_type:complete
MKKICFVSTTSFSIENFLKDLILTLSKRYKVFIICTDSSKLKKFFKNKNIRLIEININRKINIFKDIKSLVKIFYFLKKNKIDIVHSIMPKSGLLSCLASFFSNTKVRVHTFTGQVWCNMSFLKKFFFIKIDEIIFLLNTHILADSFSQKKFLERNLNHKNKLKVLANGSISGFDIDKFKKIKNKKNKKKTYKILYLGRITKDKGVMDLIEAYEIVKKRMNIELIIAGKLDDEEIKHQFLNKLHKNNIRWIKNNLNIKKAFLNKDLFCSLSLREGFGNTIIEANLAKLPVLITNIYGHGDIIKNKLYSRKVEPQNIADIVKNLEIILNNLNSYKKRINSNIFKIKRLYSKKIVIDKYLKFYDKCLIN